MVESISAISSFLRRVSAFWTTTIDRGIADDAAQQRFLPVRIGAVLQRDIARDAIGQPIEAGCIDCGCSLFGERCGKNWI
jgi:hypothetical protein